MKMTKKVLSLLLALSMVIGVFSVVAYAKAPDSAVDLYISCDKASYMPGDEVTLTVSQQVAETVGAMYMGGQYAIGYNSTGIVPLTTEKDPALHGFTNIAPGYDSSISDVSNALTDMGDTLTEDSKTAYGWDSVMMHIVGDDSTEIDCTNKTDLFSFKMKIPENAPNGEYVVGFNKDSYVNYNAFSNDATNGGLYGYDDDYGYGTTVNYSFGTCTIKVGAATEASILKPMSSQIRFKGVGSDADFTNYGGTFDVRTRATISTADFNAKFTDEETAKTGISDFGFVYAAQSNVAAFDIEAAKGVAQGTAAEGYVKQSCTYMQRTADGYNFTCLIKDIPDADHAEKVNCIAYVCFNGEYIFFDAPATADYGTLYDAWKK